MDSSILSCSVVPGSDRTTSFGPSVEGRVSCNEQRPALAEVTEVHLIETMTAPLQDLMATLSGVR